MRKAPRLSECIRFPRQKTKYYVTCGHKYLKGYSEKYGDVIWSDKAYSFVYKTDALLYAILAKSCGYLGLDVFSITYPNNQIRYHNGEISKID